MPRVSPAERLKEHVQAGQAAYAAGRLAEAGTEWSAALRSARRLQAPETLQIALYNNLAGLYMSLGQHRRAKRRYRAALATAERIQGPGSHSAAVILNNLAELERAGGKAETAEPLFRRALAILERAENGNPQQLGSVLGNIAECLREMGRLADAVALNARALSILESVEPAAPGPTGVMVNNMARIEAQRENYREAELLYERASDLFMKAGPLFQTQLRIAIANHATTLRQHAAALDRLLTQEGSAPGLDPGPQPGEGLSVVDGSRPGTVPPAHRP